MDTPEPAPAEPDPPGATPTDLGVWPGLKLARAQSHLGELHSRFASWRASHPYCQRVEITDDRLSWRLVLEVRQPPPLDEWSLIAGDCVHNFRSTLDAAVWGFATLGGASPPRPKQLYFPVVEDQATWEQAVRQKLAGVPERYVTRIESVQPYNHAEEGRHNVLALLHLLDIDDKHRAGLSASVTPVEARHRGALQFESDEAAARNTTTTTVTPSSIKDGAILVEQTTTEPIVRVAGEFDINVHMYLVTERGAFPLIATLDQLNRTTVSILNVLHGSATTTSRPYSAPDADTVDSDCSRL